jgi:hypothetical protein
MRGVGRWSTMLEQYLRLMWWWVRRWYGVARSLGRLAGQEEYVERAINVTEENFEQILEGDDE